MCVEDSINYPTGDPLRGNDLLTNSIVLLVTRGEKTSRQECNKPQSAEATKL